MSFYSVAIHWVFIHCGILWRLHSLRIKAYKATRVQTKGWVGEEFQKENQQNFLSSWCVCVLALSCVRLFAAHIDCSPPSSSVYGISQQEYWRELPFPPPGYLSDPGIEPTSPVSPVLQTDSAPLSCQGSPLSHQIMWWENILTQLLVSSVAEIRWCHSMGLGRSGCIQATQLRITPAWV